MTSPAPLQDVRPVAFVEIEDASPNVGRESWMHVEIDRIPDGEDIAEIEESIQRVLRDVREAVEDWDKMHAQVAAIVHELAARPPSTVDPEEARQARALLQWLADDHFTFLGYREYRLERARRRRAPPRRARHRPRASSAPTRTSPARPASCPRRPRPRPARRPCWC